MSLLPLSVSAVAVALAGLGAAGASPRKVLAPGDPPLTQDMVDAYVNLAVWRLGPGLGPAGRAERLAQMVVNDWQNGDRGRQEAILADLKWWHEDFPNLSRAELERLAARNRPSGASSEQARQAAQAADVIHRLQLQQRHDARQQDILTLSNVQAKHHELMMLIIANLRPSGRYEYNPATGRYDRYVP